jgi:recombination DNA repair RAD52 pathway protein
MGFSDLQQKLLTAKLDGRYVRARQKNGVALLYIEGWHAIAEANRVFGFDG